MPIYIVQHSLHFKLLHFDSLCSLFIYTTPCMCTNTWPINLILILIFVIEIRISQQGSPGGQHASFWGLEFPAGQCFMPHSWVCQGVDKGSHDSDPVLSWPAQFPDQNPIKNLFNVTRRKTDDQKTSNKAGLVEFLLQEWHQVTQEQLSKIFPRRMNTDIKCPNDST